MVLAAPMKLVPNPTRRPSLSAIVSKAPTVGAFLTIALNEGLRVWFGTNFIGAANTIYGILLILFIIFMPRGILGVIEHRLVRRVPLATAPAE